MKRLFLVVFIVAMCSALASAASYNVSGGLLMGSSSIGNDDVSVGMSGLGFWVGGSAVIDQAPVALKGSFSAFGSDEITIYEDGDKLGSLDVDSKASILKAFAGYQLPMAPVAVGAGIVSQRLVVDYSSVASSFASSKLEESMRTTGLAIAAFGAMPVSDALSVSGEFYFVPKAQSSYEDDVYEVEDKVDSGVIGLELGAAYQVAPNIGVEAGYRFSKVTLNEEGYVDGYRVSGLFFGGKFTF